MKRVAFWGYFIGVFLSGALRLLGIKLSFSLFLIHLAIIIPTLVLHTIIISREMKPPFAIKWMNLLVLLALFVKLLFSAMSWPGNGYILLYSFAILVAFYITMAVSTYRSKLDSWDKYLGLASGAALLLNILPVFKILGIWWDNLLGRG